MRQFILIMLAVLLLSSCSKNERTIAKGTFDLSLNAVLPEMPFSDSPEYNPDQTKATTQYTVRIKWAAGDKISVINLTTGKILGGILSTSEGGNVVSFSGSLSGTVNENDVIAYFYPPQNNVSEVPFTGINIDMSTQGGTTGSVPLCVYKVSTANSDSFNNATMTFSYLMGYMMIGLSDIPSGAKVKSVTLTNLTSTFDVNINSAGTDLSVNPHVGDIKLTPGSAASAAGVKTVYAAIPGSAAATRFTILETETTDFTTSFSSAKLNNGTAYNTNVSGFLVDDLIPQDEAVREYCLAHFDTNGDGKLSMVEIAGVTELPEPLPSDIRRFNELEYFYGLTKLPTFKNQPFLESITIPKQITVLPDEFCYGCPTLTKVYVKPEVPPVLGKDSFYGLGGKVILVVGDDVVSDYQQAEGWLNFFNNFRTESSQNESNVEIDMEDEMGSDRVDIIVN